MSFMICITAVALAGVYMFQSGDSPSLRSSVVVEPTVVVPAEQIIGGQRDAYGCLTPAGYSWCEAKQKCLRVWEEPCSREDIIYNYLRDHISELSPEPEVLGGKFYITDFKLTDDNQAVIDYEDGHIVLTALVVFALDGEEVTVQKFSLSDTHGYAPEKIGNDIIAVEAIRQLFADKYGYDIENVHVTVTDDRGMHVRGSVLFFDGGPGEGGNFLAVMEDGVYQLVFDGNGNISCSVVQTYRFPSDMVPDCADE